MMNKKYDCLIFLVMLYMCIDLSSMVFAYKIITFKSIIFVASSLIFPMTYSIMDVIAEVYGYQIAKRIIVYGFICDVIFAFLVCGVVQIPSITISQTMAYREVLGGLLRPVVAQTIGVISGAMLNIILISKWKKITNGRYFWLRSIGSSTIGEAVMLIISVLIALVNVIPAVKLYELIIYTFIYKIVFAIVIAPVISFTANILKIVDGASTPTSIFNPFDKLHNEDLSPNFQGVKLEMK